MSSPAPYRVRAALNKVRAALDKFESADDEVRRLAEARGQHDDALPIVLREGDVELRDAVHRGIAAWRAVGEAQDALEEVLEQQRVRLA